MHFSRGLGASDNASDDYLEQTLKGTQIVKRGQLTKLDHDTKMKVLEAYEKTIVNYKEEHAIVIDLDGNVYEVIGQSERCRVDALGKAILQGSYATHNHPKEETLYSFSNDDIMLFVNNDMSVLRGNDYRYVYEMNREFDSNNQDLDDYYVDDVKEEDDRGNSYNFIHWTIGQECFNKKINYWRKKR